MFVSLRCGIIPVDMAAKYNFPIPMTPVGALNVVDETLFVPSRSTVTVGVPVYFRLTELNRLSTRPPAPL